MKIIHIADLHIDSKMECNLSAEKARQRKRELIHSFENVVDYAKNNGVGVILICGDMFDTPNITTNAKQNILNIFKLNPNIDFILISGNHEEDAFIKDIDDLNNVKVFGNSFDSVRFGDVVISGTSNLKNIRLNDLKAEDYNIVMLHGQVSRYESDKAQTFNIRQFGHKNIDYLALGHLHSYSEGQIDERGKYVYCGCLEPRGFDECGNKGFCLLDTDKNSVEFVPFSIRTCHYINVDITNKSWVEIEQAIYNSLKNINTKDLIKIELTGSYNRDVIKHNDYLQDKLKDTYFFVKIVDNSQVAIDKQTLSSDKSFVGEFVRLVLNEDIDYKTKNAIIECGLNALNNREV